ncbi:MAG: MFS transporter [Deltaproteobacteria bacterium]|nr:MFS transporter [Deltaproteobacteria bacterium]
MVEAVRKSLRESAGARWAAMAVVSFTMLCGYFVADVASPLKPLIEQQLHWNSAEYGLYTSAYGWFNVFLGMLVIGGIILDKKGPRFAGVLAMLLMLGGAALNWYAMTPAFQSDQELLGTKLPVLAAAVGYAFFGVGLELCGITATKVIAKWFKGYEMALAMGLQVAVARIGTGLALGTSGTLGKAVNVSTPVLLGVLLLGLGLVAFLVYCTMDRKLAASEPETKGKASDEEAFRISDIGRILSNKGFWYIAILCALFYSAVFPFLKYATDLMVQKYHVSEDTAGLIPAMLPFGTMLLTPVFGRIYDKKGRGATIMIIGSALIMLVHVMLTIPAFDHWLVAVAGMLILGVGFSLVPSAMWPSVPKLIPERQLGTAYALIFFLQNLIALMGTPFLVGWVLDRYCITGRDTISETVNGVVQKTEIVHYDYTLPMTIFVGFGLLAIVFAFLLKAEDKKKNYGLENPIQVAKKEAASA